MSKYKYTEEEKKRNIVLKHQDDKLKEIEEKLSDNDLEAHIESSEKLLKEIGIDDFPNIKIERPNEKRVLYLHNFEDIYVEAEQCVGSNVVLEDLFSRNELKENEEIVRALNEEYKSIHRLDKFDVSISVVAGLIGAIIDIVLVGIPEKGPDGLEAGILSDFVRKKFEEKFNPNEMEKLANSKESKVPYDAQDNRNTTVPVEGLSSYYHRVVSLGHDPILGFVFGLYDIMHGTMTTIDKKGKVVSQVMNVYADRKETDIVSAFIKQIIHFKSDITTSMGLPAPMMALFNKLQFGSIGEEEQTIAEIVQGMYYEGFDFIHFCAQSISTIAIELVVRIAYAVKSIKEGNSIKDSIPISLNREKHPKLATMLFMAHCEATAINLGKIIYTDNPMAINYPQWLTFARYSYKQLKWVLLDKPIKRDKYVRKILDDELFKTIEANDIFFDEYTKNCYVVMD